MTSLLSTIPMKDQTKDILVPVLDELKETVSKPRIKLVKWILQGIYSPKIDTDTCSICKEGLTFKCVHCISRDISSKCVVALGKCGHGFHKHCIEKWTEQSGDTCPIDQTNWKYDTENCDITDEISIVKKKQKDILVTTLDKQNTNKETMESLKKNIKKKINKKMKKDKEQHAKGDEVDEANEADEVDEVDDSVSTDYEADDVPPSKEVPCVPVATGPIDEDPFGIISVTKVLNIPHIIQDDEVNDLAALAYITDEDYDDEIPVLADDNEMPVLVDDDKLPSLSEGSIFPILPSLLSDDEVYTIGDADYTIGEAD
jgi:RING-box protein 1